MTMVLSGGPGRFPFSAGSSAVARKKTPKVRVNVKASLSRRLREIRQELFGDHGGPELARRLNLPARTWYNYETGVTVPAEVLLGFIEQTGANPMYLISGQGPKYRMASDERLLSELSPVELIRRGVLLEELAQLIGRDYDPFDLVCHVAYDRPPLTRAERARRVQKDDVFTAYGETARAVLAVLLDRYADRGIEAIEEAVDPRLSIAALRIAPLDRFGTPMEIVRAFGGRDAYAVAVRKLHRQLYHVS